MNNPDRGSDASNTSSASGSSTWTRAALWALYDAQTRGFQRNYTDPVLPQVVTTEQIASTLRCPTVDHRPNHTVQLTSPLQLPEADLPIPPYALRGMTW